MFTVRDGETKRKRTRTKKCLSSDEDQVRNRIASIMKINSTFFHHG